MTTKIKQKKSTREVNVGVDIGKSQLDLYLHEEKIHFSVENNPKGIRRAISRLKPYPIGRIVVEATGRYEHDFVEAALDKGLPVIIANPLQVRRYAGAVGLLAKTDKIDCRLIAEYAAVIKPEVRKHKSKICLLTRLSVVENQCQVKFISQWIPLSLNKYGDNFNESTPIYPTFEGSLSFVKRHI